MRTFSLVLSAVVLLAASAWGQEQCAPRKQVLEWLEKQHDEKSFLILVSDSGQLIEVTRSAGGSWTMLLLRPDGQLCLVMSGGALRQSGGA